MHPPLAEAPVLSLPPPPGGSQQPLPLPLVGVSALLPPGVFASLPPFCAVSPLPSPSFQLQLPALVQLQQLPPLLEPAAAAGSPPGRGLDLSEAQRQPPWPPLLPSGASPPRASFVFPPFSGPPLPRLQHLHQGVLPPQGGQVLQARPALLRPLPPWASLVSSASQQPLTRHSGLSGQPPQTSDQHRCWLPDGASAGERWSFRPPVQPLSCWTTRLFSRLERRTPH
mmetsp:Transcript_69733/g.167411  ORF Transcript_69733/g.167411 Transcript_69733/m.167411 type:complete len:226 (+) Transcript_69733:954-1631(+)